MRRPLELAGLLVLTIALAVIGWLLVITTFMLYDDEGYVLLTQINHLRGLPLYDAVFTQYGPAPYLYMAALHQLLGLPLTHVAGRALTVLHWVAVSICCGLVAWRLSRAYWTAVFTAVITFGYLWQMTSEPGHPGGFIVLLNAAGTWLAVEGLQRRRPAVSAAILGVIGALLFLTKINVGVFWLCAIGAFALLATPVPGGRLLAAAGMAVLPFGLMYSQLSQGWVFSFALIFALSAAITCAIVGGAMTSRLSWRFWRTAAGAFLVVLFAAVAATLAHGTSPQGLIEGVLLSPLRMSVNFSVALRWPWPSWLLLAAGLGLPAAAMLVHAPIVRARLHELIAVARLGAFILFLFHLRAWLTFDGVNGMMILSLQLAPLFLLPLPAAGQKADLSPSRGLLALLGVSSVLHAYPVAGSQMGWATFLLLPLYVVGLNEAVERIAARLPPLFSRRLIPAVGALALVAAGLQLYLLGDTGWQRYRTSESLGLPGAEGLRIPENLRSELRILTWNAGIHADVLFSRPGMYSFNIWSGAPAPTLRNATHWFWLLTPREQQAIIDRLQAASRSAIITCQSLNELNERLKVPSFGPLDGYLAQNYRLLFSLIDYEFWVPRDSNAVPFFTAETLEHAADNTTTHDRYLLVVNVAADTEIAEILLRDVRDPAHILFRFDAGNCRVTAQPITSTGRPIGAAAPLPLPGRLHGLYRLSIFFHDAPTATFGPHRQLVFLTPGGQPAFEALFPQLPDISAQSAAGSPPPEI